MNLQSIRGRENGEYDRLEDPLYVHGPITLLLGTLLLERATTVMFWGLESNPIVLQLGMRNWLLLTVVMVGLLPIAWYGSMGFQYLFNRILVYGLSVYHLAAAVTNVAVVFFV